MKRLLYGFLFVSLGWVVGVGLVLENGCAQAQKGVQAKAQAGIEALTAAESFAFLNPLNEKNKIFPKSYWMPIAGYKKLRAETCFGVRLASGRRLVGESNADGGLFEGHTIGAEGKRDTFLVIGVLHAEFPFRVGRETMPAGPYVVQTYPDKLELIGEHEIEKHYDSFRRETVPAEKKLTLALKERLPDEFFVEKAKQSPRFTVTIEGGAIVLALHANKWTLIPQS